MSYKNRTYLVRNNSNSSYFFRLIIPRDLRKNLNNTRELRVSLKTGIHSEARRISQQLKFQADNIFEAIRCGNISTTCVTSIKELLKERRDKLLLQYLQGFQAHVGKNNGIDTQNGGESPPFTPGPPPTFYSSDYEDMKLDPDLKLVKSYYNKFKYKDVLEFCEENSIEPTEDLFPKRFIRRCRQNIIKMLEATDDLMETAEEIALEVIEAHLDALGNKDLAEFFARLGLPEQSLEKAESREEILETLEDHVDTVKLALKIGVDILFQNNEEDQLEETEEENEEQQQSEPDFEIVCRNWKRLYKPPANKPSQGTAEGQAPPEPQSPRLSEVSRDYFEEMKTAGAHSPKTMLEKKSVMERFLEITGDPRVNELSHEVARKYKQTLMKLPANLKKDKRYRNLSIEKVVRMKGVKPIAVNTVNNNLAVVIAFMNWARKNGYVKENYFEGLKLAKSKKAQEERKAFSEEDIKAIFTPATYRKSVKGRPSRYWVPFLGLFTGARLNELCQLHVEDVIEKEGIWCISINDNSEDSENPKKLKNKASERLIPVHERLIKLGFIDFVNRQRQNNHVRLFPELKHGIDGFSRLTSRWFNETYLRNTLGITDKRKTFHSFRHTVADGLKQQRVSESYISELLGHSSGKSETFGRYGKKYRPKILLEEAVSKIRYEGLEL